MGCTTGARQAMVEAPPEWGPTYALSNPSVEVHVAPAIGRVTHFSRVGEKNLLWTDPVAPFDTFKTFRNFGGDKLWPWPQAGSWGWPPPAEIDAGPYTFGSRSSPGYFAFGLSGPAAALTGLEGGRMTDLRISGLKSVYRLRATRAGKPVAAWSVVQVPPPEAMYARLLPDSPDPIATKMNNDVVRVQRLNSRWAQIFPEYNSGKVGLPADLLAARWGDRVLVIRRTAGNDDPNLERAVSAQIYTHQLTKGSTVPDETTYIELEFIGPTKALAAGEQATLETTWDILTAAEFEKLMQDRP